MTSGLRDINLCMFTHASCWCMLNTGFVDSVSQKSSHNDVLNRLADMGDEPDRRKMLERLFAFMEERGTPIVAVPTISKIPVDLFRLYHIVKDFGGMVEASWLFQCLLVK